VVLICHFCHTLSSEIGPIGSYTLGRELSYFFPNAEVFFLQHGCYIFYILVNVKRKLDESRKIGSIYRITIMYRICRRRVVSFFYKIIPNTDIQSVNIRISFIEVENNVSLASNATYDPV